MTTITISLPDLVARQLNEEIRNKGFATRSEFIRNILRQYFIKEPMLETFVPRSLEKIKLELAQTGRYSQKFIESTIKGLKKSSLYENKASAS